MQSGFTTWTVSGPGAGALAAELEALSTVALVTRFGNALHVSGRDAAALDHALAPYRARSDIAWEKTRPALEDIFISLMRQAADNYP